MGDGMKLIEIFASAMFLGSPVIAHPAHCILIQDAGKVDEADKLYKQKKYDEALQLLLEEEKTRPSLAIDELVAQIYTERNFQGDGNAKIDHFLAIPRWESVLKAKKVPEYEKKLLECRETVASVSFGTAQACWNFQNDAETRKTLAKYGIETKEQARFVAKKLYETAIEQCEKIVHSSRDNARAWRCMGISLSRFARFDEAIEAMREYVRLEPENVDGYKFIVAMYSAKGEIGNVMDELDRLKEIKPEIKRAKLADGIIAAYDEMREMGRLPVFNSRKDDDGKVVELFYLLFEEKWSVELKKEKWNDRNFTWPLYAVFLAGTVDYQIAKNDEKREAALQRLEKVYENLNGGLNNGLPRLDRQYYHVMIRNKSIVVDKPEKFYEVLKARYEKK
ncbi:MAG: hypothetical protein QW165_02450 [Candidatus Woesearchaeota archaeon]